ncbi:MAG: indolepyruvate oxidoreductase subunit beta [Candidatus Thorarchaeota archaeon]
MSGNTSNTINVLITGVGGQGVLTLSEILAKAALDDSLNVRVGEIHGMAQRGGHVVCSVRIGDDVYGPIIDAGTADLIIGFEPVETLREIHFVKEGGYVVMNSHVQYPVAVSMGQAEYPAHDEIIEQMSKFTKHIIVLDAMKLAKEAGSSRSMNMVLLGAIIGTGLTTISKEAALNAVQNAFPKKFESTNVAALKSGLSTIQQALE